MNNDKSKLDKGDFSKKYQTSDFRQSNNNQDTVNPINNIKAIKNFIELWKFTKSEIITLKSLIELNNPTTCLRISQLCNTYTTTVYKALEKLEKKGIVKKDNHNWNFIGIEELYKILSLRVQELIKLLCDEN